MYCGEANGQGFIVARIMERKQAREQAIEKAARDLRKGSMSKA